MKIPRKRDNSGPPYTSAGKVDVSNAAIIATFEESDQRAVLAVNEDETLKRAKEIRKIKMDARRAKVLDLTTPAIFRWGRLPPSVLVCHRVGSISANYLLYAVLVSMESSPSGEIFKSEKLIKLSL